MTQTTHTPGPWRVNKSDPREIVDETGNHVIAGCYDVYGYDAYEGDSIPNARLIAAAPVLLETLTSIVQHAKEFGEIEDAETMLARIEEKARAALAEATGGEG